jgi:hypothetical protein
MTLEGAIFFIRRQERRPMISNSKLGAAAFIAAIGLASPAFAQASAIGKAPVASVHAFTLVACYDPSCTGGGSAGYNHHVATDYRLKHHSAHAKDRNQPAANK